jgi:queuosine precursor transporter
VIPIIAYIACILLANVLTAFFPPFSIFGLIVPAGTLFLGGTFFLRDWIQRLVGKRNTYLLILLALLLSAGTSRLLGDSLWIVFASALTFLLSETTDTEIYSRLSLPFYQKVKWSGIVSSGVDSVVFVVIGLSPWGAEFLTWNQVPHAIVSQWLIKGLLQIVISWIIMKGSGRDEATN